MNKSLRSRVINSLIAFWHCNKHIFIFVLPIFLIADLMLPITPGAITRMVGTGIVLFLAAAIMWGDSLHAKPTFSGDSDENLKRDMALLWRKEEPQWSRPLMLVILFTLWYFLMIRHDLSLEIVSLALQNFSS